MLSEARTQAPTIGDAEKAAAALMAAGAGEVWLYGSVARGESRDHSDIDLVAIFDDLDYRRRLHLGIELNQAASNACNQRVEVLVTDRPEWRIQTTQVPASFASAISDDLVLLASKPCILDSVDWDKQQVMPTSDEELADERLRAVRLNIDAIGTNLEPSWAELELTDSDEYADHFDVRAARLIAVCAAAHLAIENAAKALAVSSGVEAQTLWTHNVADLVDSLESEDNDAVEEMLAAAPDLVKSSKYITMWRERGAYGGPTEGMTAQEVATPAFTAALAMIACDVALYAADTLERSNPKRPAAEHLRRRVTAVSNRLKEFDIATGEPR